MNATATISIVPVDTIIKEAKIELRTLFSKTEEIILRIGQAFEASLIESSTICTRIKQVLREEVRDHIISNRQIERCCPNKWKKSTKPRKNVKLSFLDSGALITNPGNQRRPITAVSFKVTKTKFMELATAIRNSTEYCKLRFDQNLELAVIEADKVG